MSRLRKFLAMSFRAKVLVPVIAVIICLLAVTAWVVDHRITKQFEIDATHNLVQADEGFRAWQKNRAKNLLDRVRDLRTEPSFTSKLRGDFAAIKLALPELCQAAGSDVNVISYSGTRQQLVVTYVKDGDPFIRKSEFQAASAAVVKHALQGEDSGDTIHVGDELYEVVSIPAFDAEGDISGAVTFGMEIGKDTVEDTEPFT